MKGTKFLGAVLVVLGVLASADGGSGDARRNDTASVAPLKLAVREQEAVVVPVWTHLGVTALGALLLARDRHRQ